MRREPGKGRIKEQVLQSMYSRDANDAEEWALIRCMHGTSEAVPVEAARVVCKAYRNAYVRSVESGVAERMHNDKATLAAHQAFAQHFPKWQGKPQVEYSAAVLKLLGFGFQAASEWMCGGRAPPRGQRPTPEYIKRSRG